METLRRAIRNIAAQLGSQAVTWTATLLLTAAMARNLGDSGFGVLYLALSFVALFDILVDFGLETLVMREVARTPERLTHCLIHGLLIKFCLWVVSFLAIQVTAELLDYPELTRHVLIICSITMLFSASSRLIAAIYRGLSRLGNPALGAAIEKVFDAVVGIAWLSRGAGVVEIAWVLMAGALLNLSWQAATVSRRLHGGFSIQWDAIRSLLRRAAPFVAAWVLTTIYWKIDAIMLSKMTSEEVVGWYGAAYRLIETLIFLPNIVASYVAEPLLSQLSRVSHRQMKLVFEKELNVLLAVGIPMCTGLVVLAPAIIGFIYGTTEFGEAIPALQVLAVALLLLCVNSAAGGVLVSLDRERWFTVTSGITVLINVSLNWLMIPHWLHVGAAIATVISELAISVGFFLLLPKWIIPRATLGIAARAVLATAGMTLALLPLQAAPVFVSVPVGVIVYAVLALSLRVVPSEDLAMLRQALRRRGAATEPAAAGVDAS